MNRSQIENINQLLSELKNCAVTDISKYFAPATDLFPLLSKMEQQECTKTFYQWAAENADREPLKFCYAKFFSAMNSFLSEQHETALNLVTEAQLQFDEQNDPDGMGICASLMGGIYRTLGNIDLALKTLWESYGLLKQSGAYSHFLSACTCNMASINLEMHNHEEAVLLFKITYEQCEKVDDQFWMNYALHGLGKVYLLQHKYPEAKEYLEKAMLLAGKSKNPLTISNSLTELGNYYFQSGHFTKAEQLHNQALVIREQQNFIGGAVTNSIRLGEVYIKQSKWKEALDILGKALALAEQIKVKPKIFQVHLLLSEIYESKKELRKSLFHFKLFHRVREQVEQEDNARKLKNARLIFEAGQTHKENIIIKEQKAEIENKNAELQQTIDELTLTKVSRKAKALTLGIAVIFFIFEDSILHFALHILPSDNYYLSLLVKMGIIFSLNPINRVIEKYLLRKVIRNKKQKKEVLSPVTSASKNIFMNHFPLFSTVKQ